MGMRMKFRSRQTKPLQEQTQVDEQQQQQQITEANTMDSTTSNSTTIKCPSVASSISSSSQPHSPITPNSPSLGSYSPSLICSAPSTDSPTLKAGFELVPTSKVVDLRRPTITSSTATMKVTGGILLHNTTPVTSSRSSTMLIDSENENIEVVGQKSIQRPGSDSSSSSSPSLRFMEVGPECATQQQTQQRKHVAYATAFDGSIVRRREITTPSSTGSFHGGSPRSTPGCELYGGNTSVVSSSLPSSTSTGQFEYSRIYYSSGTQQKRKGLRGILAR